ncbi:Transcriptional regulator, AraC family [Myxococcus hansupus]|uniref:Transcriptional regulator, AraC family n=1 Tax=Pseudomyxococcus hansupus TaxID=1297742 RepID=A0A0H4WZR7_9BACT|nr:AraC family transcriptional regulator [Myxococcus hansupus]AKQ68314.1 Transcriptional regulator, AraC family [Myxococcus hansupus]
MILQMQSHLLLGGGRALYVGSFHELPRHRFAANAVLVGLDDAFDLIDDDGRVEHHEATFVRGWQWHSLDFRGGRAAMLFLEPGAGLRHQVDASVLRAAVETALAARKPEPWSELFQNALNLGPSPLSVDARIARVAELLSTPDAAPADAVTLSQQVGASTSLVEHRFKEQVGVPIGAFRAWYRMEAATSLALKGRSLTEVAHAAGFYDSAHFSRLFRGMFGMPPSKVFTQGLTGAVFESRGAEVSR